MNEKGVIESLGKYRIVPVVVVEDPAKAIDLADALTEGGLPLMEVTFRTPAAAEVIRKVARERPGMLVGAGTVLNREDLLSAANAGASFCVSPGFNNFLVEEALQMGMPFFPGVLTPTEIEGALGTGVRVMKFFPAEQAGGVKYLNGIAAPFNHLGIKFIPTGGITAANLGSYLAMPQVLAVGGTWIARKDDLEKGNWEQIRNLCREAVEIREADS